MIREDFRQINVLRCVDEEAPPEDVEEDEEHRCVQSSGVTGAEEFCCQGTQEDDGCDAAERADQHESPAAEAVDCEGGDGVTEDGEGCPYCI